MPITGSDRAVMYAQSGVMRAGASRANYTSPKVFVAIDGTHYASGRDTNAQRVYDELSLTLILDETPDTCTFKARGFTPSAGQDVVVTLGSKNNLDRLFAGTILAPSHGYVGTPGNDTTSVRCIDYTWHLTRRKISRRWTNTSATDIAIAIVAEATGFTSNGVEAGLATLDEFTVTNDTLMNALLRVAKRIGGYCDVSCLKGVSLRVTPSEEAPPQAITDSNNTSATELVISRDLSQVITRVLVEGGGVNALAGCAAGETILPVQDVAWYNAGGGTVVSGPQRITYAGVREGGAGSLVGPGASPAGAPALALAAGAPGVESGAHNYAYTFVTAAGESLPSPVGEITTGPLADPTAAATIVTVNLATANLPEGFYNYAYTFLASGTETLPSPIVSYHSDGNINPRIGIGVGPGGTTGRNVYRSDVSAVHDASAQLKFIGTVADNTTTGFNDVTGSGAPGGSNAPVSNTTVMNNVSVSSIAIGGSGTTARKVYRTAAGASQLKLLATIADNTTTTYADSTADGSLGANAPTSDTSGLTQPSGQVLAGATTLLLAGTGAFSVSGGWVIIGNGQQVVRYTGISGNSLTGIPSSGAGAITASIAYNSTATAAPCLTGIPSSGDGAILYDILSGDEVNLLVVEDDVDAQTTVAALIGGTDDGVIEEYVQDRRLSETEARARAVAILELRSAVEESVSWTSRDLNTRPGRSITITVTDPVPVNATYKIQQVTISDFWPALMPTFRAAASSTRFSLEDLLKNLRKGQD